MSQENKTRKLVVIGGVAGGATAAARARRLDENLDVTVLERGPYVSFANCGLPYFISRDITKRSALLLQTPEGFYGRYKVNVRLRTEALAIDRARKVVKVVGPEGESEVAYDKLILAQGGNPVVPPLPGVDREHVFQLWSIPHMDRIHKYIDERKPAHAVVAGGGFIGLEMVEALKARGVAVTLVELAPQVMAAMDAEFGEMVKASLVDAGVEVLTGVGLAEISADRVKLSDGSERPADMVLLSIGVKPELELAKSAGLSLGQTGALLVDEFLRTNDPDIFAAGDMAEVVHKVHGKSVRMPLAGPANRQGRIAATNALGGTMKYRGVLGTAVAKVLDRTVAFTGLTEKVAKLAGFDVGAAYVFKDHHASYYPGARPLAIKLVYDRNDGRLLGGQAFGEEGVEKRVDVLAMALQGRMTLDDLSEVDLSYAPPYSSANDPVNMAAFVGLNDLSGYSRLLSPARVQEMVRQGAVLLDLRTFGEQSKAPVENALHIPLDELRDRLAEIPTGKTLLLLSKDGFLGHLGARILYGNEFADVLNIAGGYAAARWFAEFRK